MRSGGVEGADRDRLAMHQTVLRIEVEPDEMFLAGAGQMFDLFVGLARTVQSRPGVLRRVGIDPATQLEHGGQPHRWPPTDALTAPVAHGQARQMAETVPLQQAIGL